MNTKAIINLNEGIIQLEGSENFVKSYLDEFKGFIVRPNFKAPDVSINKPNELVLSNKKNNRKSEIKSLVKSKTKAKDIKAEEFDILPKGKPSLEDYFKEKIPNDSVRERVVVIAYYIKNILEIDSFTDGNIEYAYKVLKKKKKPIHLRQALTDIKNKDLWIESNDTGWQINRIGEKFVDEKLPHQEKSK